MKKIQDLTNHQLNQLKEAHQKMGKANESLMFILEGGVPMIEIIAAHNFYNQAARKFFELFNQFELAQITFGNGPDVKSLRVDA